MAIYPDYNSDGQLCPYDDCCHDLALPQAGWYIAGGGFGVALRTTLAICRASHTPVVQSDLTSFP